LAHFALLLISSLRAHPSLLFSFSTFEYISHNGFKREQNATMA
jgi:hypothetical protein